MIKRVFVVAIFCAALGFVENEISAKITQPDYDGQRQEGIEFCKGNEGPVCAQL